MATLPPYAKISPRVVTILGMNPGPFTLSGTNTYLVGTGKRRLLIDTGEGKPEYMTNLRAAMKEHGVEGIECVLLTHWHHDHTGGVRDVLAEYGKDIPVYKYGAAPEKGTGLASGDSKVGCCDVDAERRRKAEGDLPSPPQLRPIEDGQIFETEGATLKAMYTPGHTADHLCFSLSEEGAIFTGDCILGAGSAVFADLAPYLRSLERIKQAEPKVLYPAHGPMVLTGAVAKVDEYINHRLERERQILRALEESKDAALTPEAIVRKLYPADLPDTLVLAAGHNVLLHLRKLMEEKRVEAVPISPTAVTAAASSSSDAATSSSDAATSASAASLVSSTQWRLCARL